MRSYIKTTLILTIAGTLFSGYLSAVKLFEKTCPFNEPCPYFLGYPACFFGFAMFAGMLALTGLALILKTRKKWPLTANTIISGLGMLFAGYFVAGELYNFITGAAMPRYTLLLPTCAYGLVFYIIIFIISLRSFKK